LTSAEVLLSATAVRSDVDSPLVDATVSIPGAAALQANASVPLVGALNQLVTGTSP
jgi:hypothetical protein